MIARAVAVLAVLVGTSPGVAAQSGPRASNPGWVLLVQNSTITASLDTARIERDSAGAQVWLRFEYSAAQPPLEGMTAAYRRLHVREQVDCGSSRSRNLSVEVVDTLGRSYAESGDGRPWLSFREHPLTPTLFVPLCRELRRSAGKRADPRSVTGQAG